jgi:superfamily II DNA or RNA helicase
LSGRPVFNRGDLVQRVNNPESIGLVREARRDEQTDGWNYLVQFGAQLVALPEEVLQTVREVQSPWEALGGGSLSGLRHFVFTLTFHRLRTPTARMAYAFSTARTQFYPHQFKPLLKFLDSRTSGLLIADDVGLGKTIEAGYILRELQARQTIDRVLIVVPARLTSKWRKEMRLRFEEHFDVVKGGDIVRHAERLSQGREPEPFRWIVSYEGARPEGVRAAIEETQLPIDLLVADEAHRMRNPESLQHKVGAALSRCSDNVVFLTATPVQNRLEDLWNVLRLISPEEFPAWPLFQGQVEANRLVLMAQQLLTRTPPDVAGARELLEEFGSQRASLPLSRDFLLSVLARLEGQGEVGRKELIELHADISQLSPLGHIISRTRKAEAMPDRAVRSASWFGVDLTTAEREVYDSVEELCRMSWPGAGDSWGFRMSLMMAYRATTSSIPAAMRYFAERLGQSRGMDDLSDQFEDGEEEEAMPASRSRPGLNAWAGPSRSRLQEIVAQWESDGRVDTKLEELIKAIGKIWREDEAGGRPRRKIVIFSYFRRTLEYLRTALSGRGFNLRMIHGGTHPDEREFVIDEFLEREDVPILLTSEVGGEGIDLQKASVLFNYDLPWNPMVVEQRIGRLDRIGQAAKRIIIINFIVKDSIEEYVLKRLLDKIDIFRESIGEMDPIIGEEIERLTSQALSGDLSAAELKRAVEESGNALENRVMEARRMLSRVDNLLAADQNLVDEINAVTQERQIPSESDLLLFLNVFLERHYPGRQLPAQAAAKVVKADLRGPLGARIEAAAPELGPDASVFGRKISGGTIDLTLSREAGYRHPRAEMLHLRHPLVKYVVREVAREDKATAFALALEEDALLPPGLYGFLISLVEFKGQRASTRLAPVFAELNGRGGVWSDPEETTPVVLRMLERGRDVEIKGVTQELITGIKGRLLAGLDAVKAEWNERERRLNRVRREQRLAIIQGAVQLRLERAKQRLASLQERSVAGFPIRMAEAQIEKARREFDDLQGREAADAEWGIGEVAEVAVGLLKVGL